MKDDITPPKRRPAHLRYTVQAAPIHTTADNETTRGLTNDFTTVSFDNVQQSAPLPDVDEVPYESTLADSNHPTSTRKRFGINWPLSKRGKIIGSVLIVLLFFGAGAGWTLTHKRRTVVADTKPVTHQAIAKPQPKIIYSQLSGLPVTDASVNQKPVTGIMIENSLYARPQSGLSQAGVVFEAVAEGGITRFLALYQDQTPTNVGPIRSARPYYVAWDQGFDAAYAHVGGSPDALADITAWGVKDMNQFYNGDYYHRVTSRAAPHNVYTGIDTLNQLEASKGYTTSTYSGFPRKNDAPFTATANSGTSNSTRTAASSITMSLSGPSYDPSYTYSAATNSYNRSEAGAAQIDANTNAQLSPKVVIAIVVPLAQGALDSSGAYYSNYTVTGSGQALVFQDGTVTSATWNKPDNKTNISFTDSTGAPLPLNRGQTWITAVTALNKVQYK